MKKVLTIAGSDCSGGAGIQADLKTYAAHRIYGMSVITSITAQNTVGVSDVFDIPVEMVKKQIDAVFTDIRPDVVKIGMVSSPQIITAIAEKMVEYEMKDIVLDTVMISTSGHKLLMPEAMELLIEKLIPMAYVITPNIHEAQELCGFEITTKAHMVRAAQAIAQKYKGYILIKGGHLIDSSDDLLYKDDSAVWYEAGRIESTNTHGTGCTLSSALACNLAKGYDILQAVKNAKTYVRDAIAQGLDLGAGDGPIDHGYFIQSPF